MAENLQTNPARPEERGWTTVSRPKTVLFDIDLNRQIGSYRDL